MKTIFIKVFILSMFLLSSCSFFRSIGLYNVPPDYAETFEEINGIPFIDHPNLTANIVLELTSSQKVFSPYDSITLILRTTNLSLIDIMSVYSERYGELIVTDSLNRKLNVLKHDVYFSQVAVVDDYGRIVKPTLAPYSYFQYEPNASQSKVLKFQNGGSIFPQLYYMAFSLKKENTPGNYTVNYIQNHEEYDKRKGPINTKLISDTVEYYIRNLTEEELCIKQEAKEIVKKIDEGNDFEKADSLLLNFYNKYPDNYYYSSLVKFLVAKKEMESLNSTKVKQ